jgi:hypothetical protein
VISEFKKYHCSEKQLVAVSMVLGNNLGGSKLLICLVGYKDPAIRGLYAPKLIANITKIKPATVAV